MVSNIEIQKYIQQNNKEGKIAIRVSPNASKNEIVLEENKIKVYIKAIPDKNKANLELVKFFKKEVGLKVEIISGLKSRDKVLRVI